MVNNSYLIYLYIYIINLYNYNNSGEFRFLNSEKTYCDDLETDNKDTLFNNKPPKKKGEYIYKGRNWGL